MSEALQKLQDLLKEKEQEIDLLKKRLKEKEDEVMQKENIISKQETLIRFTSAHRNAIQKMLLNNINEN